MAAFAKKSGATMLNPCRENSCERGVPSASVHAGEGGHGIFDC